MSADSTFTAELQGTFFLILLSRKLPKYCLGRLISGQEPDAANSSVGTNQPDEESVNNISPKLLEKAFAKYNRSISQYYFDYLASNKRENMIAEKVRSNPVTSTTTERSPEEAKTESPVKQQVHETFPFEKHDDIDRDYDNIVELNDNVNTAIQPSTVPAGFIFFQSIFDFIKWVMHISFFDSELYAEEDQ